MSNMVRKQIYIHRRQEILLKRMAHLRGISEAEVIREAIDQAANRGPAIIPGHDRSAWEETLQFIEERKKLGITGEAYSWNRQEIYDERENRWATKRDQGEG